eukprot:10428804-Alexandrium_andersonii.AAC.1
MSASLVGSEMCIRDRCTAPELWGPMLRPVRGRAVQDSNADNSFALSRICLLYTSDAADDM